MRTDGTITRRRFLRHVAAGSAGAAVAHVTGCAGRTAPERTRSAENAPNFIVIFTDDQGYQDLGCFGSTDIRTPHIDRMAEEGTRFTDFYVAAPACTPSRAALMTGCYPKRVSMNRVLHPRHHKGLHPDEVTIADVLKGRGYATACVGKWHLGHRPGLLPTDQGFDSYFGIPYSNDMGSAPLMRDAAVIEQRSNQDTLTERYTDEAERFIRENRSRPFLLYLAHSMPHVPLHASERFRNRSRRGLYGDVIECLDWSTGRLVDTVRDLGIAENTWVIYTSDNGPWLTKGANGGSALPLRGAKATTYEGGIRVPCVVWAPGRVPAGQACAHVASTIDLLPTFARLAGTRPAADRIIDGVDISGMMTGDEGAAPPRRVLYFFNKMGTIEAVREGDWKLRIAGGPGKARRDKLPPRAELYDLARDISERNNVAAGHPDVIARLIDMMRVFDRTLAASARPAGTA